MPFSQTRNSTCTASAAMHCGLFDAASRLVTESATGESRTTGQAQSDWRDGVVAAATVFYGLEWQTAQTVKPQASGLFPKGGMGWRS